MVAKLIRIYTPFIFALAAIIHGVLYLAEYQGVVYRFLGEFAGHSFFALFYILATSKRMCRWFRITLWLLLSIHVLNLCYIFGWVGSYTLIYTGLVINILALLCFLVFRVTRGVTKILC